MAGRMIRASEVGEYLYCRRAWWLRQVQGVTSAKAPQWAAGQAAHAAHGSAVQRAHTWARLARWLVLAGALLLALRLLGWVG